MRFNFYFIAARSDVGGIMIGMERQKTQKLTIMIQLANFLKVLRTPRASDRPSENQPSWTRDCELQQNSSHESSRLRAGVSVSAPWHRGRSPSGDSFPPRRPLGRVIFACEEYGATTRSPG